jgi:hypothetical protein
MYQTYWIKPKKLESTTVFNSITTKLKNYKYKNTQILFIFTTYNMNLKTKILNK